MKNLMRNLVWWPGIDQDIENTVKTCAPCKQAHHPAPLQPWKWLASPWAQLNLDYAGLLFGYMFLILVDAHSKVKLVKTATSAITTEHLRNIFATHGSP